MNEIELELSEEQITVILEALNDLVRDHNNSEKKEKLINKTMEYLDNKLYYETHGNECIGCGAEVSGRICRECSGV